MKSISQTGQKISEVLGDSDDYGVGDDEQFTDFSKLRDMVPIHTLLPYQTYDAENRLFLNDNSLGFGVMINPLLGASEQTIESLHRFVNNALHDGNDLHVILIATNKVGPILSKYKA